MKMNRFTAILSVLAVMGLFLMPAHAQVDIYNVGSDRQLFIDNAFFDQSTNVGLQLHQPTKTGQKVLQSDKPWESIMLNWFSVIQDQGVVDNQAKYRMWYAAYDLDGDWTSGNDNTSFCYAESRDGIHWTKPELGLFEYQGSKKNNILFRQIGPADGHSRVHGTGVFIDPTAPPEARYKAVSRGMWSGQTQPYQITGMVSPDGLKWTRLSAPICNDFADSQYSGFWDASLGKYVLYGRVFSTGSRAIGRAESSDFSQFPVLQQVLRADGNDPSNSDLYNPAAMKYAGAANVYMMFPSLFQHTPDTLDIRLAVSRDGVNWTYPDQSKAFIPLGDAKTWDSGSLYMGQGAIQAGDETWLYYSGSPKRHNVMELEDVIAQPRAYSRVTLGRDRFVSVEAGKDGGWFVTPPLRFSGNTLKLNVEVRPGGKVRVALLDEKGKALPGRGLKDCVAITGDHLDAVVRWNKGTDVGARANQPTRMRVELGNASLFGFQFAAEGKGGGKRCQAEEKADRKETEQQRDARMAWFREAKFGMFIHWGPYCMERFSRMKHMPVSKFGKFRDRFNPVKFDAKQWVAAAKGAGMKYLVITSKHHDGFAMFDTKLTDWGIMSTPFRRDPIKELAAECKKAGIKFCVYYSIMDWHHPDYVPRRPWNDVAKAKGDPDFDRYVAFMEGQLKELVTNYGPLGILWFDGEWEESWTHERGKDLYAYVRGLQPDIIINNRVGTNRIVKGGGGKTLDGGMSKGDEIVGDYGTPEQEIPAGGLPGVDWESCMTMNDHWRYNKHDQNWKSSVAMIRMLIDIASKGGNYLLNVGPTSEGLIPEPSLERLREIGKWMKTNGEAIYGVTACPFSEAPAWGRVTQKPGKLYLHVFDWPKDGKLALPAPGGKPAAAYLLADPNRVPLKVTTQQDGIVVALPAEAPDPVASVVVLDIADEP